MTQFVRGYLAAQRFDTAETALGAGVSTARLGDWIKRGAWSPLTEGRPGTGRSREFIIADVYRLALVAALTDPNSIFEMPVTKAVALVDDAFGLRAEKGGNTDFFRDALRDGTLPESLIDRSRAWWLVGGIFHRAEPREAILRGQFTCEPASPHALPNPLNKPRAMIALEVPPILAEADKQLLELRGLGDLATE